MAENDSSMTSCFSPRARWFLGMAPSGKRNRPDTHSAIRHRARGPVRVLAPSVNNPWMCYSGHRIPRESGLDCHGMAANKVTAVHGLGFSRPRTTTSRMGETPAALFLSAFSIIRLNEQFCGGRSPLAIDSLPARPEAPPQHLPD